MLLKIAFGCQARVGKDEAAKYIRELFTPDKKVYNIAFASPLHELFDHTCSLFGLSNYKDRTYLQFMGVWARNKNADVFVEIAKEKIEKISDGVITVSDVRYKNEFDMLKQHGFIMVRITKHDINLMDHESEQLGNTVNWDYIIENDGTLDEYHEKIKQLTGYIQ